MEIKEIVEVTRRRKNGRNKNSRREKNYKTRIY